MDSRLLTPDQMRAMLTIVSEAATASCEKKGALEAIPHIGDVRQRFQEAGREWPISSM